MDINDKFGIVDDNEMSGEFLDFLGSDTKGAEPISLEETPKAAGEEFTATEGGESTDEEVGSVLDILNTKPEDKTEETPKEETQEEVNQISSLAKDLTELGIFSEDDTLKLPETEEEFKERFEIESKKKANEELVKFLGKFGDDYFKAFQAIFVNGVDPREYFNIATKSEDILTLDLEQEANQKKIVKKYYQEVMGLTEARTDKMLEGLIEDGELDAEALKAFNKFKESRDNEIAQVENEKIAAQQRKEQEKQYFNNNVAQFLENKKKEKEFNGMKFGEAEANTVFNKLVQPAYRLPNGELISEFQKNILELSNPENIDKAVIIQMLWDNNFDLTKVNIKKTNEEKKKMFTTFDKKPSTNKTDSKQPDLFKI